MPFFLMPFHHVKPVRDTGFVHPPVDNKCQKRLVQHGLLSTRSPDTGLSLFRNYVDISSQIPPPLDASSLSIKALTTGDDTEGGKSHTFSSVLHSSLLFSGTDIVIVQEEHFTGGAVEKVVSLPTSSKDNCVFLVLIAYFFSQEASSSPAHPSLDTHQSFSSSNPVIKPR